MTGQTQEAEICATSLCLLSPELIGRVFPEGSLAATD
jgi:hypothetical protein